MCTLLILLGAKNFLIHKNLLGGGFGLWAMMTTATEALPIFLVRFMTANKIIVRREQIPRNLIVLDCAYVFAVYSRNCLLCKLYHATLITNSKCLYWDEAKWVVVLVVVQNKRRGIEMRACSVCACIKWHAKHSRNANIFARWGKELEMYLNWFLCIFCVYFVLRWISTRIICLIFLLTMQLFIWQNQFHFYCVNSFICVLEEKKWLNFCPFHQ